MKENNLLMKEIKLNFQTNHFNNQMILQHLTKNDEYKVSFMRFQVHYKTFDFFLGQWNRVDWTRRIKIERKALFKLNK